MQSPPMTMKDEFRMLLFGTVIMMVAVIFMVVLITLVGFGGGGWVFIVMAAPVLGVMAFIGMFLMRKHAPSRRTPWTYVQIPSHVFVGEVERLLKENRLKYEKGSGQFYVEGRLFLSYKPLKGKVTVVSVSPNKRDIRLKWVEGEMMRRVGVKDRKFTLPYQPPGPPKRPTRPRK